MRIAPLATETDARMEQPDLPAAPALPAERNPAAVYLASLADGPARASMRSTLRHVAATLGHRIDECPWHELRYHHVVALRAQLKASADRSAPATVNKYLSAVRQVAKQAWLLELMPGDAYQRLAAVQGVKGSRLPAGRALDAAEVVALFRACADGTPAGLRDAAGFALMFGTGLRRAEAVAVRLPDYDRADGSIRVVGKGDMERVVFAPDGAKRTLDAWLVVRGEASGPLLAPVAKGGKVAAGRPMTAQALMLRLRRRAKQAAIKCCSPHDLRRTFVSAALEAGADLAMVQALAGHASPKTTARYDRRPVAAKRAAAQLVHVPFFGDAA